MFFLVVLGRSRYRYSGRSKVGTAAGKLRSELSHHSDEPRCTLVQRSSESSISRTIAAARRGGSARRLGAAARRGGSAQRIDHAQIIIPDVSTTKFTIFSMPATSPARSATVSRSNAEPGDPKISNAWGFPAQRKWFEEATNFAGRVVKRPAAQRKATALEDFLENQRSARLSPGK